MKPSSIPKKISYAKARNAALLNQLATPGLGSLVAGRWLAGIGQLFVFLAGFVVYCAWAFKNLSRYYGLMFSDTAPQAVSSQMAWIGAGLCVASWIWSLQTSISLMQGASKVSADALKLFGASLLKMDESRIGLALAELPDWKRNGQIISRTFEFEDFPVAMKFVNAVAALAEQAQHHPDIDVRWNKVTLALTTHDAGGLTEKDFAMARECDSAAEHDAGFRKAKTAT
jgi:4a-hydroxytetrahydrobiopterin dehydratase